MATAIPKPPAKELAAIAARAAAAGKKPTQAAILATYNRNQARAAAPKSVAAPAPPAAKPTANAATALSRKDVIARATAAGKKPTTAAVNATLAKNKSRLYAAASKKALASPLSAPQGEIGGDIGQAIGAGSSMAELTPEITAGNDYWNNALARLKAGEMPKDVFPESAKYGGGGPEQNLSAQEYMELVLTQYQGSDNAGNIDTRRGMTPAGIKAWLKYLAKKGPRGYVGPNTGSGAVAGSLSASMDPAYRAQNNAQEWRRNMEIAGGNAKLPAGRYGFGYDDTGRPLTDAELIALVRGL